MIIQFFWDYLNNAIAKNWGIFGIRQYVYITVFVEFLMPENQFLILKKNQICDIKSFFYIGKSFRLFYIEITDDSHRCYMAEIMPTWRKTT